MMFLFNHPLSSIMGFPSHLWLPEGTHFAGLNQPSPIQRATSAADIPRARSIAGPSSPGRHPSSSANHILGASIDLNGWFDQKASDNFFKKWWFAVFSNKPIYIYIYKPNNINSIFTGCRRSLLYNLQVSNCSMFLGAGFVSMLIQGEKGLN